MITPLSPETLAWLHQAEAAEVSGAIVLRHVLERLEALENDCIEQSQSSRFCNDAIVRRLEVLEAAAAQPANPAPAATEMAPTPEGAPVATDEELLAIRSWLSHRPVLDSDLGEPGRQHGAAQSPDTLAARVLAMCKKRNWSLDWTSRGAYLHLEASELIEALRGKRGEVLSEAADVLLVLMSITENAGIPWAEVLNQTAATCARLEVCNTYPGEERDTKPTLPVTPYGKTDEEARRDRAADAGKAAADASFEAVLAVQPTPPAAPVGGLVERLRTSVRQQTGAYLLDDECQVAIREVAAWLDSEGCVRAASDLREEVAE